MIKFVVPKPVKKIKRTYTPIDKERRAKKVSFRFFSIKVIRVIFGLFVLLYGSYYLLSNTIFDTQYTIKRVIYDSGDIQWYDEPYMYRMISDRIKDENYYVVKRYINRVLLDVQSQYPIVTDIGIDYRSNNTVFVKLTFKPIDMVIRNQDRRFALVDGVLLPLYSGNNIANSIKILDMPEYLSGLDVLSGLFYRIPAKELIQQIELLYEGFPGLHHIEYLPGGERSIVFLDGRKYYINNLGDISNQIRNFQLLKKYYKEFDKLAEIDLGSLEKDKIIVRKF